MKSTPNNKLNLLFFCNLPAEGQNANTVVDHVRAFTNYSKHQIYLFSHTGPFPDKLDLSRFDVIVIHYTITLLNNYYISQEARQKIADFKGLKVLFIQDEYRQINFIHNEIKNLGIHILFTCIPETSIESVYPTSKFPELTKINVLTGYVPEYLLNYHHKPIAQRTIDVGYRARKLPLWYGELAVEKWKIVDGFKQHTQHVNLKLDLSYQENKRIYGDKWLAFVTNCRAMLGVESGASVMDFSGDLERTVERYQLLNPQTTFDKVRDKFLLDYDGNIYMNQISPRCFEAIALKTPLILFEGRYSDILQADRHYISLKKDFSNIDDVTLKIKDVDYLQQLANTAFHEIAYNPEYSYHYSIQCFDKVINQEFISRKIIRAQLNYSHQDFKNLIKKFTMTKKLKMINHNFQRTIVNCLPQPLRQFLKVCLYAIK